MVSREGSYTILKRRFLAKVFVCFLSVSLFPSCGRDKNAALSLDKNKNGALNTHERRSQQKQKLNKNGIREISFDDIVFEMAKDEPFSQKLLTERVTSLVGQEIRIRGYILPSFQQSGLTQFVLVRDNMECCFGPGAALFDCIVVKMLPGRTAKFSIHPVAVTGTFGIKELKGPDGSHLAVYSLNGESVQ